MENLEILEQLFDNGFVTTTIELIPNKLKVTLRSLSVEDYLAIDKAMLELKGSRPYVLQSFAIEKLSRGLRSYKSKNFSNAEEAKEFLTSSNMSSFLLEKLVKEQTSFETKIQKALDIKEVEQAFFVKGDLQEKPEQSPVE